MIFISQEDEPTSPLFTAILILLHDNSPKVAQLNSSMNSTSGISISWALVLAICFLLWKWMMGQHLFVNICWHFPPVEVDDGPTSFLYMLAPKIQVRLLCIIGEPSNRNHSVSTQWCLPVLSRQYVRLQLVTEW